MSIERQEKRKRVLLSPVKFEVWCRAKYYTNSNRCDLQKIKFALKKKKCWHKLLVVNDSKSYST